MNWIDGVAMLASGYASACLQLRSQALKPHMADYPIGPLNVRLALFALSLVLGAYSVTILIGDYQATRTEALLVCAVAWTAHVLWRNVRRQGRDSAREDGGELADDRDQAEQQGRA